MNKKTLIIEILTIITFIIIIGVPYYIFTSEANCYNTTAILHSQQLGKKGCCDDCLVFNVTQFDCSEECGCDWNPHTFFFGNEFQEREDLKDGEEIEIKWCYVRQVKDFRIKGVNKK